MREIVREYVCVHMWERARKRAQYVGAADLNIEHARNITRRNLSRERGGETEGKRERAREC